MKIVLFLGGIVLSIIFSRTSTRSYLEKEVEADKIELLIRAGMQAPSAHNQQPWEFYVVRDKAVLKELSSASKYAGCVKNAPLAIVVFQREGLETPEYAMQDLGACCENILLESVELGLGGVWLGIAPGQDRMAKVSKAVGAPDNLKAFSIISIGYPAKERQQKDRFDPERVHYI